MTPGNQATADSRRRANSRLAWILASVALVFALGFVAKIVLFAH